jgi:hypothetical protein
MTPSNPMSLKQVRDELRKHAFSFRTSPSLPTTANALERLAENIDLELKRRESEAVPVGYMSPKDVERFDELHKAGNREFGVAHITSDESNTYAIKCYTSPPPPPSQPSTGVPDGWQLVPIEPTLAMQQAWYRSGNPHPDDAKTFLSGPRFKRQWDAMISAAPRSP